MKYLGTIIKTVILVYLVVFSLTNRDIISVQLVPGLVKYNVPLFLPILCALLVGGIVTALAFASERMRLGKELKSLRKKSNKTETELHRLQNAPLLHDSNSPEEK